MKRFITRSNRPRSGKHSDVIPELIARYGMQMLDNVHRCREAWPPRRIK